MFRYLDVSDKVDEVVEVLKKQNNLMEELQHEDEDLDEWFNASVTELNASASSLDDSHGLHERITGVREEIER